jgi:predicted nucleic acid-binding protein
VSAALGVADTSVFIATEAGRSLDAAALPDALITTTVTLAELELGVLTAQDVESRARRIRTLGVASGMTVLSASTEAARHWARLAAHLGDARRRTRANDLWIAAIATANGLPVVTQDAGFDALADAAGVQVIRI